ncbi:MAG: hypothetical protein ACC645_27490, partial [Pirellulales bacterium]
MLASPPSARLRLKKFVYKYRGPVAATVAVLVAFFFGLILALAGFARARQEQRLAMRKKAKAATGELLRTFE